MREEAAGLLNFAAAPDFKLLCERKHVHRFQTTNPHNLRPTVWFNRKLSQLGSRNSSVSIETRLRIDDRVSIPGGGNNETFSSSPPRPDRLWGPLSFLSNAFFPRRL